MGALIFICFAISDSLRCVLRGLIMQNFPGAPPPSPITKLLSINLLHFGPLISICFAISDSLICVLRGLIIQNFPGAPPP